ncbi:hypothetical protein [Aureimonas endophytica]|uniref:hypothetical protein n=1 Tax=Aureimonas endophytica TaxID=2027858 RepID=UPI00166E67BF|nr:hypothetical protein [Aureimonas endophytica]
MVEHGQINLRVPDDAKDTLKGVADKIRRDSGFLARLKRFMDEDDGERSAFLAERMDRLERRVADLETARGGTAPAPHASALPRQENMFDPPEGDADSSGTAWATGEGRGRRLTPAGKAEMQRRIAAGERDNEIAAALGVRPNSVVQARKASAAG